ncbi:MAG TPA: T9SS type A sorting domain-containing protein, partial [Bacteroidota bacterium]|nr:T9SS type A sorting domain-containing protein [Bacteroidota bacterium]
TFDMPPPGPAGSLDARFSSQQFVETLPNSALRSTDLLLMLRSQAYPVTIHLTLVQPDMKSVTLLNSAGKVLGRLTGKQQATFTITDPNVHSVTVRADYSNSNIPGRFALAQNYPNPFNPTTTIRFDVPENAFVTLKVYNILGQEVKTLADEQYAAGSYAVSFNGSDLATGVYYYRMSVLGSDRRNIEFSDVKKLVLVK